MALPSGYTRLEYIESTGTQCINTEVEPDHTRILIDAYILESNTGNDHHIASASGNFWASSTATECFNVMRLRADRTGFAVRYGNGNLRNIEHQGSVYGRHIFDRNFLASPYTAQVDEATSLTLTPTASYRIPCYLPLFAFRRDNGSYSGFISMRLYSCKIWKTTTDEGAPLIRDFIPCKNASGVVGLWDDVNSKFYGNAGTGTFTAGPIAVDLTAHKTLVNGTAYTVQGGKCMVDGTIYNILKGRTLIDGTAWDIALPSAVHIYGVEWDWTSSGLTKGVRTDDAAGFNDPSPAVSNGSGSSPFDTLYPWCNMVRETRTGGVEVKEPKYYFKWTKTGKKLKLQIADGPVEGFSVDPVNRDRGDGLGELDYSYIGRYHCGSGYKSTTNVAQKVNITRSAARNGIHNLGSNFWQMDFAQFWYVNMLFLVEFADWNGERIGRGCSSDGSKMNNGQTDAMQYHTGTTAANRDSYGFTQYRNIEGWWDNVYDWMDGCYYGSNGLSVISNPNNFSDSANGTLVGKMTAGSSFPSDLAIPTLSGFEWALYPSAFGGSQTTYVPDIWAFVANNQCLYHGGATSQKQNYGPFYISCSHVAGVGSGIGCRLQERPPKA